MSGIALSLQNYWLGRRMTLLVMSGGCFSQGVKSLSILPQRRVHRTALSTSLPSQTVDVSVLTHASGLASYSRSIVRCAKSSSAPDSPSHFAMTATAAAAASTAGVVWSFLHSPCKYWTNTSMAFLPKWSRDKERHGLQRETVKLFELWEAQGEEE